MDQLRYLGDDRMVGFCVYCGGPPETRDHVPSRVLLDTPYPENLPVVESCERCNGGFSSDEEYLACLIDCVVAGSTANVKRQKIARILRERPALALLLEAARTVDGSVTSFRISESRVRNVISKLAQGHVAYELGIGRMEGQPQIAWSPFEWLDLEARERFETPHELVGYPEVGSRASQRFEVVSMTLAPTDPSLPSQEVQMLMRPGWLEVQEGRYRYLAQDLGDEVVVRIVLSEFLACEVVWSQRSEDRSAAIP